MKKLNKLIKGGLFTILLAVVFIPTLKASSIDDVLESGKAYIKSVKPTSVDFFYTVMESFGEEYPGYYFNPNACNTDYTKCTLKYAGNDIDEIELVYVYDEAVKTVVDDIVKDYPTGKQVYVLNDVEMLNLRINGGNMASNSHEFSKNIKYKNFRFDVRGGGGEYLTDSALGIFKFVYDDTIYYVGDDPEFDLQYLVYVDENATDIEKSLEERLTKLFPGHKFEVLKDTETKISDIVDAYIADYTNTYNENSEYFTSEYGYNTLEEFLATKTDYDFTKGAEEYLYTITVDDGQIIPAVVKKSSEKVNETVPLITNDVDTDVTIIATSNAVIPLDTLIQVARITSGEEYSKIVNLLNVTNAEMFDLKLYSKSINDYITKLEDGKFEVSFQ